MTLATKSDLDAAIHHAQWGCCYTLRGFLTSEGNSASGPAAGPLAAAYHAGEAWAYYQASDLIATLEAKVAELKEKLAKKEKGK